jgi:hypothetical protein
MVTNLSPFITAVECVKVWVYPTRLMDFMGEKEDYANLK